jgi:transcriptional regulator with XRE-family HTH domain
LSPIQYSGVQHTGVAVTSAGVRKPTIREVLATNIRREALARGVGLNALADLAGVSRSGLYSVLAGETAATVDWVEKVAGALDTDVGGLLRSAATTHGGLPPAQGGSAVPSNGGHSRKQRSQGLRRNPLAWPPRRRQARPAEPVRPVPQNQHLRGLLLQDTRNRSGKGDGG